MYSKERVKWTVGKFCDEHYKLKMKRDEIQQKLSEVKEQLKELEEDALECFGRQDIEGARGSRALGYIEEREHVQMSDRALFDKYVIKTKHLELFQGRVSAPAWREITASGIVVPGVNVYTEVNFRTRKL